MIALNNRKKINKSKLRVGRGIGSVGASVGASVSVDIGGSPILFLLLII